MNRLLPLAALLLCTLPLAGCLSSSDSSFDFVPGEDFKPTGRTIHLKATVVDYDQEIYSGLDTFVWAFCFAPFDPADEVSKAAIEPFTPLPGDVPVGAPEGASCSVPGPTLRVKQGDRVIVEFTHTHFHPHTIHWHGQFVPWESDGAPGVTQDSVESGGSITYDFIAKRAGTLWYHCHVDTQFHVQQGLYGMMIVEPQEKKYEPKDIDGEFIMVLSTMNRNTVEAIPGAGRHSHPPGCASGFPAPCENPTSLAGKPDVFLLNGHSYPYTMDQKESLYIMEEGNRYRMRILNAGETTEVVHPHGHDMQVVAKDGNPLAPNARYFVDTLLIGPAERYDVVIEANNPGPWMVHTHVSSHETNCGKAPGGMHTMLVYEDFVDKMHEFRAEASAQCAFGSQLSLPGDLADGTTFRLDSGIPLPNVATPVDESFSWPVEQPCAVQRLVVRGALHTSNPLASQNDLEVRILDTTGAPAENGTFTVDGDQRTFRFVLETFDLAKIPSVVGNYTVEVSGTAVDASMDVDVFVDYYESFEESKVGHLLYKTSGCVGYT